MAAAGVECLVKMLMVLIAAVAMACHMVQALIDIVMVSIFTHQAMTAIISLVVVMLVKALSHHQRIRVGAWAAMVKALSHHQCIRVIIKLNQTCIQSTSLYLSVFFVLTEDVFSQDSMN